MTEYPETMLGRIAELTDERQEAQELLSLKDEMWQMMIRAALKSGKTAETVAEAARITRSRVYQIRDGRR